MNIVPKFTIKPAIIAKHKTTKNFSKVSKKFYAVIIKDKDDTFKARLTISPLEESEDKGFIPQEYLVLPLTPDSLILKGKTHVFSKNKDKYGHYICYIRERINSIINPGLDSQYDVLKEGILISGRIVEKDGKNYFNYEELIAFSENGGHLNDYSELTNIIINQK